MKKVKVTDLPLYNSLKGLYTLGVDKDNRSVQVSLQFLEDTTSTAVANAETATEQARDATTKALAAKAEAQQATTNAQQATAEAQQATAETIKSTAAADASKKAADEATAGSVQQTAAAKEATEKTNAAISNANSAAVKAEADTATAIAAMNKTTTETLTKAKQDVETNIASNNKATSSAVAEAQQATAEAQQATIDVTAAVTRLIPTGMEVQAPESLTTTNREPNHIKAKLFPDNTLNNVIFISDNRAVDVDPDGRLYIVAKGTSRIHVVPTTNTALAKTIVIKVTDPTMRMGNTHGQMRFTSSGGIRLN